MKDVLLTTTAATPVEVWFQDEARVGQQGSITYVWAPIGSRPPLVRDNRHDSVHLFGAICPERAVGAAIIMPAVNTEAMNEHLIEISAMITQGAHAMLDTGRFAMGPVGTNKASACAYPTTSLCSDCRHTLQS